MMEDDDGTVSIVASRRVLLLRSPTNGINDGSPERDTRRIGCVDDDTDAHSIRTVLRLVLDHERLPLDAARSSDV